jgi:hypothetical protein
MFTPSVLWEYKLEYVEIILLMMVGPHSDNNVDSMSILNGINCKHIITYLHTRLIENINKFQSFNALFELIKIMFQDCPLEYARNFARKYYMVWGIRNKIFYIRNTITDFMVDPCCGRSFLVWAEMVGGTMVPPQPPPLPKCFPIRGGGCGGTTFLPRQFPQSIYKFFVLYFLLFTFYFYY